jgi:hypothetical protein
LREGFSIAPQLWFFQENFLKPPTMSIRPEICCKERTALAAEALRLGGKIRLRAHGESMLPALWPGAIAEIEECSLGEIRPGDVVLATRDGRLFLHRFLGHCVNGFVLRGDSVPVPDPVFPPNAFLGRLTAVPRRGTLALAWYRAAGLVLCYCGLARRLALALHRWRNTQSRDSDTTVLETQGAS